MFFLPSSYYAELPFLQLTRKAYLQLNMEVELDVGEIPNLKEFVSHLTQTMHSSLPGSLVIWFVKEEAIYTPIMHYIEMY